GSVVMSTQLPSGPSGGYYARAFPQAEPIVVAEIGTVPEGMYISAETPSRSLRTYRHDGKVYGIAAGGSFKPGHSREERREIAGLTDWLQSNFAAGPPEYCWINEDYRSIDARPSSAGRTERASAIWSQQASVPGGSPMAQLRP